MLLESIHTRCLSMSLDDRSQNSSRWNRQVKPGKWPESRDLQTSSVFVLPLMGSLLLAHAYTHTQAKPHMQTGS
jgi:hypothetical protein